MRQEVTVEYIEINGKRRVLIDIYHDGVLIDHHNVGSTWVANAIEEAYERGFKDGKREA